jgi:uracil-DNA glycosylase family 4
MIQTTLTDLFGPDDESQPAQQATPLDIIREVGAAACMQCRLGLESPHNRGFIWKGNPDGRIAVLGDMPSANDMSAGRAFADEVGNELNSWLRMANIPEKDIFFTYMVQCKTPVMHSKVAALDGKQRTPHPEAETGRCFPNRAMRVLRAMPNLEVCCLLGLDTMEVVLGGNPQIKSHQGNWFGSDLLPGVACFGLPHPRTFDKDTGTLKRGRLKQCLLYFQNEYLTGKTRSDGKVLAEPKKVLGILRAQEEQRRQNRQTSALSIF